MTGGKDLGGYYSFIEDFRRNRVSATQVRRARFWNGLVRDRDGQLRDLSRARFTADANPVTNIDAGIEDGRFFLATGGETRNAGAKLKEIIERPNPQEVRSFPEDLPPPRPIERLSVKVERSRGIGDWLRSEAGACPVRSGRARDWGLCRSPHSGRERRGMGTGTSKTRSQSPSLAIPGALRVVHQSGLQECVVAKGRNHPWIRKPGHE